MVNSVNPDLTAPEGAVRSGFTLFGQAYQSEYMYLIRVNMIHWIHRDCICELCICELYSELVWKDTWVKSWSIEFKSKKTTECQWLLRISSLNGLLSLNKLNINQRSYYNLPNSAFWGWLSVESQPQNPEFRNNLENFQPWGYITKTMVKIPCILSKVILWVFKRNVSLKFYNIS